MGKKIYRNSDEASGKSQVFIDCEAKKNAENESDLEIWKAFKKGSSVAYKFIYERNIDSLYRYGISLGAEKEVVLDCIQDLFAEVWLKREKLGKVNKIKNYLFISFRRRLLRLIKRKKNEVNFMEPSLIEILINKPIEGSFSDERIHRLKQAISKLSRSKQEVINLRFFHDYSCEEIASIMGIKKQSVYNKISSALKIIKNSLLG